MSTTTIFPTTVNESQLREFITGDFSSSDIVCRARQLVPRLKARAPEQSKHSKLLPETVEDLKAAGLFQMLQPSRHGGLETTPIESFEATTILAEGDASVGWVHGVTSIHHFHLGLFDDRAQREVWGTDTQTLVSSPYMPQIARRVEGGYLISGTWKFASGTDYCDWALLGANIAGEPTPPPGPAGSHVFLVPRSSYEVIDNWDVSGLRATGSNDILLEEVFVPEYRTLTWNQVHQGVAPGLDINSGLLYRLPFFQVFSRATQAPTSLGALQGFTDDLIEFMVRKRKNPKDPAATLALAEARSFITEAKTTLYSNYAALITEAEGGPKVSPERLNEFRFQSAIIPARAARYGTELYRIAGAAGVYNTESFGRYMTDLLACQTHATNNFQARAVDWIGPELGLDEIPPPMGVVPANLK
ncbi:acyl-CoA dehydrogenase family protein [Corynebacterium sp. A21]|uniref:acyl-CoA dehydrogenase family protein n=1 Tax=Corynebacterium sp. A21 TaxID=3457318 RepID=UPI003FD0DB33